MNKLDDVYSDFIRQFKIVLSFVFEKFGTTDILLKKNEGNIPARNFEIKWNGIVGYVFHGSGCEFRLKDSILDVEFDQDNIGFTEWSFYLFSKSLIPEILQRDTTIYLKDREKEGKILFTGKIFILHDLRKDNKSQSLSW